MGWIAAFCQWRFTEDKNLNTIKNIENKKANMNMGDIILYDWDQQYALDQCSFTALTIYLVAQYCQDRAPLYFLSTNMTFLSLSL